MQHKSESIQKKDIDARAYHCLQNANINTLDELEMWTANELLKIKNFGPNCLVSVVELLYTNERQLPRTTQRFKKDPEEMCIKKWDRKIKPFNDLRTVFYLHAKDHIKLYRSFLQDNEKEAKTLKPQLNRTSKKMQGFLDEMAKNISDIAAFRDEQLRKIRAKNV